MFALGSLLYANIFWIFLIILTTSMMLLMNMELLASIARDVRQGVTKQSNPSKIVLWGWSLFFYLPLIISLLVKAPDFITELVKPFDQVSHNEFEKALEELERPNPLQVLATGYLNNGGHEEPKPKGFEKYLGIDFQEEIDAFKEKEEALKNNKGYDHYMQKGIKRKFIDNKDGTITDESLGLMWQDTEWIGKGTYKVNELERVCKKRKTIGGYEDWQVPTAYELKSLMNFNEDKIADNIFKYGYDAKYDGFWSATNDNGIPGERFVFYFEKKPGYSALEPETTNERKELLRCVRRLKKQKPLKRFDFIEDVNRQVILDKGTSLMWQNEPYSSIAAKAQHRDNRKYKIKIGKRMGQVEAIEYCKGLELGGYDDWYLPNINQTMEIGQGSGRSEFIAEERPFTKLPTVWDEESYYPFIHNSTGYTDYIRFVRCVRDAKVWNWEDLK